MLRVGRAVSLLLARERGAHGHAQLSAPLAPVALAHPARGRGARRARAARAERAAARRHRHADAGAGVPGARAAAPAQHPGGLPPGAAGRARGAGRARRAAAGRRRAPRPQRHALLLRV